MDQRARPRKVFAVGGALIGLGALVVGASAVLRARPPTIAAPYVAPPASVARAPERADAGADEDEDRAYSFRMPTGDPAALSCEDARRVIAQVRGGLAYEPDAVAPKSLATGTTDWLDPHGLWSAAPDSPVGARIERVAGDLLGEVEGRSRGPCAAADAVGAELAQWVAELRGRFDAARATARGEARDAAAAAEEIPFDAIAYARPARSFAEDLGARVGAFEHAYGESVRAYGDAARERFFPTLDAGGWGGVVLAATVRAYVPLVDPHGAWAPLDEEQSVYEVDLASHPPPRLWDKSERTAIGVRLGEGASAPLEEGDLVLAVGGLATAGLPLEQLDQLSFAAASSDDATTAVILREGERALRAIKLDAPDAPSDLVDEDDGALPAERVPYGDGDALVVAIHDVRDDLGDALARAIGREREAGVNASHPLRGVVLDLRGNGGGSTDGAIAALGLFLPGEPLFPMRRRDGTLETDRAPEPPSTDRWTGPVATLVDGETASAAEMIAGALAAYRRAPTLGTPTYGKGCAQEYVDDDARGGVLRLTTLLYALPDGQPVQRVGIAPTIGLSLAPLADTEREATLAHAAPSWRGPDVREPRVARAEEAWPAHGGAIGPCKDADVCKALRALGSASNKTVRATRQGAAAPGRR